jgi:pimeloyl-ACP methyl ester carboxylesterase
MRTFVTTAIIVVALLTAFFIAYARREPKIVERFIDVDAGGHRLHMCVVGNSGPVVVLESGLPGGLGYQDVRREVGKFARAVAYDRAGMGTSDPGPQPRDAKHVVEELRTALRNAGLAPPYVLVGQSMGGAYIRVFAADHPDEVRGMVLVDPIHADVIEPFDDAKRWFDAHCPEEWQRVEPYIKIASEGMAPLLASSFKAFEQGVETFPDEKRAAIRREYWALADSAPRETFAPICSPGARDEMKVSLQSCQQAIAAKPLPAVPIILLAAGQPTVFLEVTATLSPDMRALNKLMKEWRIADYQKWVDATPGAKLVVAKHSGHNIQTEDPQIVINSIREVIQKSR